MVLVAQNKHTADFLEHILNHSLIFWGVADNFLCREKKWQLVS